MTELVIIYVNIHNVILYPKPDLDAIFSSRHDIPTNRQQLVYILTHIWIFYISFWNGGGPFYSEGLVFHKFKGIHDATSY